MKGGGPYPGGGIPMETGKAGGTRPTPLGTAWATGSWGRGGGGRGGNLESLVHPFTAEGWLGRGSGSRTCTGIMATCWLKVSAWLLDAAVASALTCWLRASLACSAFFTASHSATTQNTSFMSPVVCRWQRVGRNGEQSTELTWFKGKPMPGGIFYNNGFTLLS